MRGWSRLLADLADAITDRAGMPARVYSDRDFVRVTDVWIWSLAMSNFSRKKDATWTFLQWATGTDHTLFGARKKDLVHPVRGSIWKDAEFRQRIAKNYPGYMEQYEATSPDAKIYFTPQPLFFNVTTDWAAALQRMVAKQIPVDEGLDQLAQGVDRQMRQAGIG